MKIKKLETQQKLPEYEEDRETQKQVRESFKKWARATCYLGLALIVSVGIWFLFFPGQRLHPLWQTWGRVFAVLSLCIFLPCIYAAGTTLNLWWYGSNMKKIDSDFASGKSAKYRG